MNAQKHWVWNEPFGQYQRCAIKCNQPLTLGQLSECAFDEAMGYLDIALLRDPHQPTVEGFVMQCIQAKTIANVQSVRDIL